MVKIPLQELVGKIAALTDHRNIDMLEISLLKTVNEMLAPTWAAIYHVSGNSPPEFSILIRGEALSHDPPGETFSTLASTQGVTAFSIIGRSREVIGYLLMAREAELSAAEHQTMSGLFRIYDNYLSVLKDSQVENHAFPQVEKITVSVGVAKITDSSMPIELLGHADQALYYAKQHGRNQVCFYEDLLARNKLHPHRSNTEAILFETAS